MFIEFITPLVLMGVSPLKTHVLFFPWAHLLCPVPLPSNKTRLSVLIEIIYKFSFSGVGDYQSFYLLNLVVQSKVLRIINLTVVPMRNRSHISDLK